MPHKQRGLGGRAVASSLVLHAVAALLVIVLASRAEQAPEEPGEPIPVDLVGLMDTAAAPGGPAAAGQQPQAPPDAEPGPPASVTPVVEPPPAKSLPKPPGRKPRLDSHPRPAPPRQPHDDFTAMLDSLRHLRKPPSAPVPAPAERGSPGFRATDEGGMSIGGGPSKVKDFLRAQIERRWEFNVAAAGTANLVVSLHLVLLPDGAVSSADVVDDPRYTSAPSYRAVADSVRRAALVASPLQFPPGVDPVALRDVVLSFSPRDVVR